MTVSVQRRVSLPIDLPKVSREGSRPLHPAGLVRAMEPADLPAIADLFTRTFRKHNRKTDPGLAGYLETVYFGSPRYSKDLGSLVHQNENGEIDSAILAMPLEFMVNGRPMTARVLCAFMAERKTGAAGAARLARLMRAARQDFCYTDNAAHVSADHWVAVGGLVLPVQSLEWHRTFRPVATGLQKAICKFRFLAKLPLQGIARVLDPLVRRLKPSFAAVSPEMLKSTPISPDEFMAQAQAMMDRFSVHPVFSRQEFNWLISVAKLNTSLGQLHCRSIADAQGKVIGCYLYFGVDGCRAKVMNVLCLERQETAVMGKVFADLDDLGYASAGGMAQPFLMNAVLRQRHLVHRHSGYFCVVSRHEDLKAAVLGEGFYAGGLASESWSRLLRDF